MNINSKIGIYFLLFTWLVLTIVALCTIIGVILVMNEDKDFPTTWYKIGIKLVEKL